MNGRSMFLLAVAVVVAFGNASVRADVQTSVARSGSPSPEFKLDKVPAPAKNDAAATATITLVEGSRDRSGGELAALNDGFVPRADDEPGSNFFFAAGTEG